MPDYLLCVEGVNFGATVLNTADISTIRGASLTLEIVARALKDPVAEVAVDLGVTAAQMQQVYAGASKAALLFTGLSDDQAQGIRDRTADLLRGNDTFRPDQPLYSADFPDVPCGHMVFSVQLQPVGPDGIDAALDRVQLQTRLDQMRMPSTPPPAALTVPAEQPVGAVACPVDEKRPLSMAAGAAMKVRAGQFPRGKEQDLGDGKSAKVRFCQRTADLREYGRSARSLLYDQMLPDRKAALAAFEFAQSFQDIVADPPAPLAFSVQGKMAVLYFDGVGFGGALAQTRAKARADGADPATLAGCGTAKFSNRVRCWFEKGIIGPLLDRFLTESAAEIARAAGGELDNRRHSCTRWCAHKGEDRDHLRIETLMLGGEDLVIVVPAWLAWDTVRRMMDLADRHSVPHEKNGLPRFALRCGALICDAKTPIRTARSLAHDLCEDARQALDSGEREGVVQFHIMESIDVPDGSLARQRARLFGTDRSRAFHYCFKRPDLAKVEAGIKRLKDYQTGLPRSQLYKLIQRIGQGGAAHQHLAAMLQRSRYAGFGNVDELTAVLPNYDPVDPVFSLKLLADLWDYVDPFGEGPAGVGP